MTRFKRRGKKVKPMALLLFFCFIPIGILTGCSKKEESGKLVSKNTEGAFFYIENKSFLTPSGEKAAVQMKIVPEKKSQDYLKVRSYLKGLKKDSTHFEYILGSFEVDCSKKMIRMMRTDYYDVMNQLIVSNKYDPAVWGSIPPKSNGVRIYQEVCP